MSSELPGGLWTGLGRGVGSNHCPALSLALWASLVGRRGPWVGSLQRWQYSREVLGAAPSLPSWTPIWSSSDPIASLVLPRPPACPDSVSSPSPFQLFENNGLMLWEPSPLGRPWLMVSTAMVSSVEAPLAQGPLGPCWPWGPFLLQFLGVFSSILSIPCLHSHLTISPSSPLSFYSFLIYFFHLSLNIFLLISLSSLHFPLYPSSICIVTNSRKSTWISLGNLGIRPHREGRI